MPDAAATVSASDRVMGTRAEVILVGGSRTLADAALDRLHELERRWSRFLPDSEISRCNRSGGAPCIVSDDTAALVERLLLASDMSDGHFDPTQLGRLQALGYDRSWPGLDGRGSAEIAAATAAPGATDIRVDRERRMVWLPTGTQIDPGGLGKGFAADLVTGELRDTGVAGALVSVGGDLRVFGQPPSGGAWRVGIDDPQSPGRTIAEVHLTTGGLATSSVLRRRWTLTDGTEAHHLIDPTTGRPAERRSLAATAVSTSAWRAEAATKVALIAGVSAERALDDLEVRALVVVDRDGATSVVRDERHEVHVAPVAVMA